MLKKILVTVIVAMICVVPSAMAAEVSVEGTYVVDGDFYDIGDENDAYYSHELDIAVIFKSDENTYLTTSFGIVDRTWGDRAPEDRFESEITLDQVWLTHVFSNGLTGEAGLMQGGTWGTMLGDADDGYLRLRASKDFDFGTLLGYVQKNQENDSTASESDESDEYSVGMILKAGDISIMPMVAYTVDDTVTGALPYDHELLLIDLALSGEMGAFGFEAELNYWDVSSDTGAEFSNFNVYADAWTTMDALKAGVALAYGSEDDGLYVDFGTDFCPTLLLDNDGDINGLGAMMLAKVYGDYTINDKLSAGCALAYGSTADDFNGGNSNFLAEDDSVVEFDLTGAYKITDALTYYVGAAYADVDSLDDSIIYLNHEIEFCF